MFSDGAEVTVRLDGRTDLWEFVRGDNPYVIKWDSAPNAVFLLDEVTYKNGFRIHADSTGVKLANHAGFKVIIR